MICIQRNINEKQKYLKASLFLFVTLYLVRVRFRVRVRGSEEGELESVGFWNKFCYKCVRECTNKIQEKNVKIEGEKKFL